MGDAVRHALAVLILVAFVGGTIALRLWAFRRIRDKREWYRQHPEERPTRRARILGILSLTLAAACLTLWAALTGQSGVLLPGVLGVGCFSYVLYRVATGREDPRGD